MPISNQQWRFGAMFAGISAIVAVLSATLTLYSQASNIVDGLITSRIAQEFAPIGTVISSMLPPVEFAKIIGETEGDEITKRTWILADGRPITGTKYAKETNLTAVPDLTGMFLRGAKGSRASGSFQPSGTALPRAAQFTGVTSKDGAHTHSGGVGLGNDWYNAGGKDYRAVGTTQTGEAGTHSHTVAITGGGDEETRPDNVAVYYYIKIN